ncbi:MAG: prephenate dehydratase domain-containing protein [Nanoarchaeota archaeon]
MKVAYLGPAGTFTERAAKDLFPNSELVAIQPIRGVVFSVEKREARYGIIPLENFYNGEVRQSLDALTKCAHTQITQEHSTKIVHCIGALKPHGMIKTIFSKDQALEQCSDYLFQNYPYAMEIATSSTAEAAERIAREKLLEAAAIAPKNALIKSGLEIIAEDIVPNNRTRFAVISQNYTESTGDDKTLLAVHPPIKDKPGVLYNTLGFISGFEINLEDIKSRPDGREGYYFYVELDGHVKDRAVKMALDAIRFSLDPKDKYPDAVKVLGSYPNTHWKERK